MTDSNPKMIWKSDATYRICPNRQIEVFIHCDKTILISRENGSFYDHLLQNDLNTGLLRSFPSSSVPPTVFSDFHEPYSLKSNCDQ